jgi:dipeptidyl-peptidase-4
VNSIRLRRRRSFTGAALALVLASSGVRGQEAAVVATGANVRDQLTLENIYASSTFFGKGFSATWRGGGRHWVEIDSNGEDQQELWQVDAASGRRTKLVAASELIPEGADQPIDIDDFSFSPDGRKLLIFTDAQRVWRARTKGVYYALDLETRSLTPVSTQPGWQMFAKISPNGRYVAFVRDHDIYLTDLESGEEHRLTRDGDENIINGTTDWVYEEELGLRDAFRWSPDGRRILFLRTDQTEVRRFYMVDETELYPTLTAIPYPKAGETNSTVKLGSLDLRTKETTWFELGTDEEIYITRLDWADSPAEVVFQRLNRHQNQLDLVMGDAETGQTRLILSESDSAWVDVNDDIRWLGDGRQFIWSSFRDGHKHLYLYNRDGTLVRQLTRGDWDVSAVQGVDGRRGIVYFTAAYENPMSRALLSARLDGSEPDLILGGNGGWHSIHMSPTTDFYIDRFSTMTTPNTTTLYRRGGEEVRVLVDNAELKSKVAALALPEPEFITVEAADGTPLNGYIIKPTTFDPSRQYALLLYVYGGPGSQTVVDRWGGNRYLWHQLLAEEGILVASVDNRGTGGRGRDFEKLTYMQLGKYETEDQLAAARQLGELPYVDPGRVGIWGWSYGGYMALMTTLMGEGLIRAGVAVAPVTSWKLYDTIYTERFMRTPRENDDGYEQGSALNYADKLADRSTLLIVHGTGDDNVHPQNTMWMVNALHEANKQFGLRLYPNKTHSITGGTTRLNLFTLITSFLRTELGAGPALGAE